MDARTSERPDRDRADRARIDSDAGGAEQAWRDGDVLGAIEAADRALAAGTDSDGRAAAVAAAGAAADGALLDAAARWRGVGARSTARPPPARSDGRRWPRPSPVTSPPP